MRKRKVMKKWKNRKWLYWETSKYHNFSFIFSWHLWEWLQTAQPELDGKKTRIGGPAVIINSKWVPDWIEKGNEKVLYRHNNFATRTTKGCIRKCLFCSVPLIEGNFFELLDYEIKPILIDNNLLACSKKHFNRVIDNLKKLEWCDFNQGLDIRLLNKYHAELFSELKNPLIRLAWDSLEDEKYFRRSYKLLRSAGIRKNNIQVYVLIGFADNPDDALYRLTEIKKLGLLSNPMRYQPVDCKKKNNYIGGGWTDKQLKDYMRYWSNMRFFRSIPFGEYQNGITNSES